jgi:ubiquinone/menaquinone biosynthesis C-methylase UbiE
MDIKKYTPTKRFSNRAKLYSQARPGYPGSLLDYLCSECKVSQGDKVADIGAGTGISSRALADRGLLVTAVEPNEAMLEEARSHEEYRDKITYVQASAEHTELPPDAFQAVVSAQAFHWFEAQKALAEFHRLLKSGGHLALIWNERDESDQFTREYGDLLRTLPDTSVVEVKRGTAGEAIFDTPLFSNAKLSFFENEQILDREKFISRALSASYAPAPDSPEAARFREELGNVFEKFQHDGLACIKYKSSVYSAEKRD